MINKKEEIREALPQEMMDQVRWCNWRVVDRDGRSIKMPMVSKYKHSIPAKASDEETWSDFETALGRISKTVGLGYFLKEPYVGIDLDDVKEEIDRHLQGDEEDNIVSEVINTVDSYVEISPSGTGIHSIAKGELPEHGRRKGDVEMYNTGRFFTVTGKSLGVDKIKDDTEIGNVPKFHEKYIGSFIEERYRDKVPAFDSSEVGNNLGVNELIVKAIASKNGEAFKKLYEGDTSDYSYESNDGQSEADLAFMNMLAFWTGRDRVKMDSIYRQSGLMRDKWDEFRGVDTYGDITMDKAIVGTKEVYGKGFGKADPFVMPDSSTKFKDDWKYNSDEPTREDSEVMPIRSADDTGNAQRLIDRFGDILKFSFEQNQFYVYNGQVWDVDRSGQTRRMVDQTVELIETEDWTKDVDALGENADKIIEKKQKDKAKHISRSRNLTGKRNMLELTKGYIPVTHEDFDTDDFALNVENGYIDLRTGEFKQSDKERMFSMMSNTTYKEDVGEPTQWLKFLDEVLDGDQEIIDFLQRALGYTLTGSTYEQVMFLLYGNGQNGKSKLIEVVQEVMGSYTKNVQAKALAPRSDNTINNDIAKLRDTRMATSSEPNDGFRFDEGLIKQITGDEVISARFLFEEEFDFMPKFKLWLTTNHKPIIQGTDDGIWRRLVVIPFDVTISESDREKDIAERLLTERDEIFKWLVDGAVEWYKHKDLRIPESIRSEKEEYRKEMNVFGEFLDDNCDIGADMEAKASELWVKYKDWADDGRFRSMNKNEFGIVMKRKFDSKRKGDGIYYVGLSIK